MSLSPLGTTTIARINNHRTVDELEMIMAFGLTMPGVRSSITAMKNRYAPARRQPAPDRKACFKPAPAARTPMQWRRAGTSVFPRDPHRISTCPSIRRTDAPNVAAQEGDADSLLKSRAPAHRAQTRRTRADRVRGIRAALRQVKCCPFVYARASGNHVLLVLFNPAAKPADAQFRFPSPIANWNDSPEKRSTSPRMARIFRLSWRAGLMRSTAW